MTAMATNHEDIAALAHELSYNEMTMGVSGSVMNRAEKQTLRERHGYCTECQGVPILLFDVQKSRMNPLWVNKKPRTVTGLCANGVCFVCHPEQDPRRSMRNRRATIGAPASAPATGRDSTVRSQVQPVMTAAVSRVPGPNEMQHSHSVNFHHQHSSLSASSAIGLDSSDRSVSSLPLPTHSDRPMRSKRPGQKPAFPGVFVPSQDDDQLSTTSNGRKPNSNFLKEPSQSSSIGGGLSVSTGSVSQVPEEDEYFSESTSNVPPPPNCSRGTSQDTMSSMASTPGAVAVPGIASQGKEENDANEKVDPDSLLEGVDSLVKDLIPVEGTSETLAEILLGTLRDYPNTEEVQVYCLRLIWDICKDNDANKQAVMAAGASAEIVAALKRFDDDCTVQEKGCGAIWSLGVHKNNRIELVRAGACEVIVAALTRFVESESFARTAIGAMRTLSPELEARELFLSLKANNSIIDAMKAHRACVSIQRDACAFLSNCAVNIEKQFVAVVSLEELDAVVQAMANHRQEISVMQGACFALKNYTHEDKNCRTLRRCKGIDELVEYAANFEDSQSCQDDAEEILESLQMSRSMDESIEDQALINLITTMDTQAKTPQAPRSLLDMMLEYDWSPRLIATSVQMFQRILDETKGAESPKEFLFQDNHQILSDVLKYCCKLESEQEVCEQACELLVRLAANDDRHEALVEAGATRILCAGLVFCDQESLVANILETMKLMISRQPPEEFVHEVQSRLHLVTDAVAAHPSNDAIQFNGIAIVSSLDSW